MLCGGKRQRGRDDGTVAGCGYGVGSWGRGVGVPFCRGRVVEGWEGCLQQGGGQNIDIARNDRRLSFVMRSRSDKSRTTDQRSL